MASDAMIECEGGDPVSVFRDDEASRLRVWKVNLWTWRAVNGILLLLLLYFTFTGNLEGMGATTGLLLAFGVCTLGLVKPDSARTVSSWTGMIKGELSRSDNPPETFSGILHRLQRKKLIRRYEVIMILEGFAERDDEVGEKAREILESLRAPGEDQHPFR